MQNSRIRIPERTWDEREGSHFDSCCFHTVPPPEFGSSHFLPDVGAKIQSAKG